ncbi:MAG TPA: phage tail sheath C-terminal domain-containing protein [Pseudacidobacterium sp.]|nr:phage tail sheath C-terminal domain-containing protein [Pseudacidobacterium sp.]
MSTTYTYPGVYIQELPSPVHTIAAVATSITAFVGYTARGIDNRAEQLFSFSDYERLFGGLASDSELSYAVQQFFQNGGAEAWVVRVPKHGATGAQVVFSNMTFTALSSGAWANGKVLLDVDYQGVNQTSDATAFNLTITDLTTNTVEYFPNLSLNPAKSNYVVAVINDPDNGSQIVNVAMKSPAPTTPPAVTGITGNALSIPAVLASASNTIALPDKAGVKQNQTQVNATTGDVQSLRVGQYVTFSGDPGTPYQVTGVSPGAGTFTVSPAYGKADDANSTVTLLAGTANADFTLVLTTTKPAPTAPLPLTITVVPKNSTIPLTVAGLAAIVQQRINSALALQMPGASAVCSAIANGTGQALRLSVLLPQTPDAIVSISGGTGANLLGFPGTANNAHYAQGTGNSFGNQTSSTTGSDGTDLPYTADIIGDELSFTGLYALNRVDLFNLLSIPDATRAATGDPSSLDPNIDPNAIYSAAIALCDQRRAFLLVDAPPNVSTVQSAVDWKTTHLAVSDANGAAFFPRLRLPDPLNNYQLRTFAPSGVVAGVYARIDSTRGVWKAPAGTEATLNGVQSMVYKLTDPENGVLNPLGLNCFRTFPVYGSVLWGARTLVGADAQTSQWKYVPVRRMALFLEESLYRGTKWVVFEPNDEPLWAAIRLNVGAFMHDYFRKGAFQGQTPDEAYFVKCDSETTTQSDIDKGVVNILVGFAPLKPAEFVVIQIEQLAGQLQS